MAVKQTSRRVALTVVLVAVALSPAPAQIPRSIQSGEITGRSAGHYFLTSRAEKLAEHGLKTGPALALDQPGDLQPEAVQPGVLHPEVLPIQEGDRPRVTVRKPLVLKSDRPVLAISSNGPASAMRLDSYHDSSQTPGQSPSARVPVGKPLALKSDRPVLAISPNGPGSAMRLDSDHDSSQTPGQSPSAKLPDDLQPWWNQRLTEQIRPSSNRITVDVDTLVFGALVHSPEVRALNFEAAALRTGICEEIAAFDWTAFVESYWDDNSDPVGNVLTVGPGATRFRDHVWSASAGLRRKTRIGGELEASQKYGWQDNNSRYFEPRPQGTTRLEISYTQPLLNASGRCYNESRIVLAQLDYHVGCDELRENLQEHLFKVTRAYWDLYRARAVHLQKKKLLAGASSILEMLDARQEVDAVQRQLLRAQAAVASRRSEIARALNSVQNAESRIRLLVGDPQLVADEQLELIPKDAPMCVDFGISMQASIQTALRNRPDVARGIREMKAASVRCGIARHELLPRLDLILSTYAAGLRGSGDISQAWGDQFREGEPGYSVGLTFEVPLHKRAAKARLTRRQLESQQALYAFNNTVETGKTEVEIAVREVSTTLQETLSRFQAMAAAQMEEHYLRQRWQHLPNYDGSTAQLLETLLDSQERLADEEAGFVTTQVNYALALSNLKRSMGTLLRCTDNGMAPDGDPASAAAPALLDPPEPAPSLAPVPAE